ncbi:la-related protein 1B-like isoform X2 [Phragmites australis]|uniref:la-related protein 1B-like isoform X2 n=1 Tax=Phragmites australis TaxID=29695 RepID=UPI002D78A605|nr:la-related protein 1B-like isoform X2 [Phragmites australis]
MATSADPHAAVAGAWTPPSDSPPAAKKAGDAAAAPWKRPGSATVPVVVPVGNPIMDADSWPALPGLASPPPAAATAAAAKASPKAAPPPSTGAVISPVSLGNSGALDANPDNEAPIRNPAARRALVMPAGDGLEKSAPAPELSPVYVPNARSNGGDHHQNGRFGSHPHGRGGSYGGGNRRGTGGGGGRRGQEHHGGFDGPRRGGGRRDGHGQTHQQRGHQPYIRAPPPPPPFISATPQAPHYGAPMGFPEIAPHVYYFAAHPSEGLQGLPFVPHPASPHAISIDPIQKELLAQIDYYFSDDNLCKDPFLRQNMDDQGWVPLSLIAGFRKVQNLTNNIQFLRGTNNIQFILETVLLSTVVEVQGDKIRRRGTWENWLFPKSNYSAGSSGPSSPMTSNIDSLASQFLFVGLEGATYHTSLQGMPSEALLTRSVTSGSLGYHVPTLGGLHTNGSGPIFEQKSARNLLRSDTF